MEGNHRPTQMFLVSNEEHGKSITIGRADDNDLIVPQDNDHVSNHHATLSRQTDNTFVFEDHSSNGTIVNGNVVHNAKLVVNTADEIMLANQYKLNWRDIMPFFKGRTIIVTGGEEISVSSSGQIEFEPGDLFDGRYKLIRKLGIGASAKVWEAEDTKANNLRVAVKIFSLSQEYSTNGLNLFKDEFAKVFDIHHSNLLHPTSYDIYEFQTPEGDIASVPYLVLQFCKNGSVTSMVGHADEETVRKFMYNVAQGLEHLHSKGIVHQDIKPDNVLIDDQGNFVITDFGITANADNQSKTVSGTPGYMGPERHEKATMNKIIPESDIWSVGAMVYEIITGDLPFGDRGGMIQDKDEPIPQLPKSFKDKKIRTLVSQCLDADPINRPTASDIIMELEPKPWIVEHLWLVAAVAAAILAIVALPVANYFRTSEKFYKDYVEVNGIPKGIHEISGDEIALKDDCYRIISKKGHVVSLTHLNSKGRTVDYWDSDTKRDRFPHCEYDIAKDGKINYVEYYDQYGTLLYRLQYDAAIGDTRIAMCNERDGSIRTLEGSTTQLHYDGHSDVWDDQSNIAGYKFFYDKNGLVVKKMYVNSVKKATHDADGIYGIEYIYDQLGRKTEEHFLGKDGSIKGNKNGLAIKTFKYDNQDNIVEYCYLDKNRQASHDGTFITIVKCEHDQYGNRTAERYYNLDGSPAMRSDELYHGAVATYENGLTVENKYLDLDGNLFSTKYGFAIRRFTYDDNGFETSESFYDADGGKTDFISYDSDGEMNARYHLITLANDSVGHVLTQRYFDVDSMPTSDNDDIHRYEIRFDTLGNRTEVSFYDKDGKPALGREMYARMEEEHNEIGLTTELRFYDTDGNLSDGAAGFSIAKIEYDGRLSKKYAVFDSDGNQCMNSDGYCYWIKEYHNNNKLAKITYYDANDNICDVDGIASYEYMYDSNGEFQTRTIERNAKGEKVWDKRWKYDEHGNTLKSYTLGKDDKLKSGTAVYNAEYDANDLETKRWYTNLNGDRVICPGERYCEIHYEEYDTRRNALKYSYYNTDGSKGTHDGYAHRVVHEFNALNQVVHEYQYGTDGTPAKSTPEGVVKYDKYGNMIEIAALDGHGNPAIGAGGFYRRVRTYNQRRQILTEEYYGLEDKPVVIDGYHKKINSYNDKSALVSSEWYDGKNYLIRKNIYDDKGNLKSSEKFANGGVSQERVEHTYDDKNNEIEERTYENNKLSSIVKYKYNENGKISEQAFYDGNNKYNGKFVYSYEKDGVTSKIVKMYNSDGTYLAYSKWTSNGWSDWIPAQQQGGGSSNSDWRDYFRTQTPFNIGDGIIVTNINIASNSVTVSIKSTEYSKYNSSDVEKLRKEVKSLSSDWYKHVPSNGRLYIVLYDKAGRKID